jgi:hypothetical protein
MTSTSVPPKNCQGQCFILGRGAKKCPKDSESISTKSGHYNWTYSGCNDKARKTGHDVCFTPNGTNCGSIMGTGSNVYMKVYAGTGHAETHRKIYTQMEIQSSRQAKPLPGPRKSRSTTQHRLTRKQRRVKEVSNSRKRSSRKRSSRNSGKTRNSGK